MVLNFRRRRWLQDISNQVGPWAFFGVRKGFAFGEHRSYHPQEIIEFLRDSPKVNVFCAVSQIKVYGSFLFEGNTVTEELSLPRNAPTPVIPFWLCFPTRWSTAILAPRSSKHTWMKTCLSGGLEEGVLNGFAFCAWPARSPDLSASDYFLWGYVKVFLNANFLWITLKFKSPHALSLMAFEKYHFAFFSGKTFVAIKPFPTILTSYRLFAMYYIIRF